MMVNSLTDTITVTTSDGVEQEIVITINGVDDLSVVAGDATGDVTEDADATTLTTSGSFIVNGCRYHGYNHIHASNGRRYVRRDYY